MLVYYRIKGIIIPPIFLVSFQLVSLPEGDLLVRLLRRPIELTLNREDNAMC